MRIIGIDPGLTKTGVGIIDVKNNTASYISSTTIYSSTSQQLSVRLKHFHDNLTEIVKYYQPDVSAIEEIFLNSNPMSSLKLGHARGALILSLAICNLDVFEYSTTQIKKTVTGVGRADKNQIKLMVKVILPNAQFKTEDEADALAVALTHFQYFHKYR
jgi:crossover junction endodeoxyribonuclease RuvC